MGMTSREIAADVAQRLPLLVSPRQAAESCGVTVPMIYRHVDEGRLVAVRLGPGPRARIRIHRDELARWLVERP